MLARGMLPQEGCYAIGIIIGTLRFSYFIIYLLIFLIFHFPSSQQSIPYALAVIAFGRGSAIWYLYIIFQNSLSAFQKEKMTKEQDSV
ncbi:unnamed protein product [Penicillium roqueforti FM164]|uniref:Genomic scaffold, ProqFM164S02 n=1 Tax=Penicillium roqueforti (strain FM164) TaxID=1365484 RepID=W6Q981_PENRF|nr:unnamed protein product [Penicillium roqueforti FM164]